MKRLSDILFSYWTMLMMFALLAIGAAVGTFLENDFGTSTARVYVYNHTWHEVVMLLSIVNLSGIIYKRKMWNHLGRFIFHFSFVVMLLGAIITRYVGLEGIMHIKEGQTTNQMISLEPFFQVHIDYNGKHYDAYFQKEFAAIGDNSFDYKVPFEDKTLILTMDSYKFAKKGKTTMNIIGTKVVIGGEEQVVKLVGNRGVQGITQQLQFQDNINVALSYGSKDISLPFSLHLRDFQLDRYPGSMAPSSYASEVTLIDEANNEKFDYRIFMNHTLKYGNYQFFQSSYDPDELGTVLSVNNDPGKWPTYLAYFLLSVGLLINMFDKKSRFFKLTQYIKQFNVAQVMVLVALLGVSMNLNANDTNTTELSNTQYLEKFKAQSKNTAELFSKIVVQSAGRMKPMDSLSVEIVNKLTRKSTLMGMEPNQIVLGMMTRPDIWQNVKMLKIKTPKLKQTLGIDKDRDLLAFSEIFDEKGYKLAPLVEEANAVAPNQRGTYEKDILQLNERLNIAYMVFYGDIFKVFPAKKGTVAQELVKDKWYSPTEAIEKFAQTESGVVLSIMKGIVSSVYTLDFKEADKFINFIIQYQQKLGSDVMPPKQVINSEILFNKLDIFPKLTLAYVLVGLVLFFVSFATVFNKSWQSSKLNTVFFVILATLFTIQTVGMGMRWFISGHAPWSNTYESLVYIGWSAMFAGLFFFRKSLMALSATVVMAGIFMFTAHLSHIDPQITNLVPVLKSYWLTIHVSIITGSYGFLAIGAMLGFMALLLFIVRDPMKRPHIDDTIRQITAINEASLIIGLAALTVGNFLGGVWANESWGRYWGWDPKETWAWVAIITYAFVLHMRFMKPLNNPYVFSVASTLAFSTILMTYFGVNFYLSGMHSYATGDPVPIPAWVYVVTTLVFIVIAIAARNRDLGKLKV